MTHNPKFGPAAQTPEQRAWILDRMMEVLPGLRKNSHPSIHRCYQRYVAGELSWEEMRQAMQTDTDPT